MPSAIHQPLDLLETSWRSLAKWHSIYIPTFTEPIVIKFGILVCNLIKKLKKTFFEILVSSRQVFSRMELKVSQGPSGDIFHK